MLKTFISAALVVAITYPGFSQSEVDADSLHVPERATEALKKENYQDAIDLVAPLRSKPGENASKLNQQCDFIFLKAQLKKGDVEGFQAGLSKLPSTHPAQDDLSFLWILHLKQSGNNKEILGMETSKLFPPGSEYRERYLCEIVKAHVAVRSLNGADRVLHTLLAEVGGSNTSRDLAFWIGSKELTEDHYTSAAQCFSYVMGGGPNRGDFGAAEFYWIKSRYKAGDIDAIKDARELLLRDITLENRDELGIFLVEAYAGQAQISEALAVCRFFELMLPEKTNSPEYFHAKLQVVLAELHGDQRYDTIRLRTVKEMLLKGIDLSINTNHPDYIRFDCGHLWDVLYMMNEGDEVGIYSVGTVRAVIDYNVTLALSVFGDYLRSVASQGNGVTSLRAELEAIQRVISDPNVSIKFIETYKEQLFILGLHDSELTSTKLLTSD